MLRRYALEDEEEGRRYGMQAIDDDLCLKLLERNDPVINLALASYVDNEEALEKLYDSSDERLKTAVRRNLNIFKLSFTLAEDDLLTRVVYDSINNKKGIILDVFFNSGLLYRNYGKLLLELILLKKGIFLEVDKDKWATILWCVINLIEAELNKLKLESIHPNKKLALLGMLSSAQADFLACIEILNLKNDTERNLVKIILGTIINKYSLNEAKKVVSYLESWPLDLKDDNPKYDVAAKIYRDKDALAWLKSHPDEEIRRYADPIYEADDYRQVTLDKLRQEHRTSKLISETHDYIRTIYYGTWGIFCVMAILGIYFYIFNHSYH